MDKAAIKLGKFVAGISGMNHDALEIRYERSCIVFIAKTTVVLIAELGVENYDEHQAIINLLTEHTVDILASIATSSQHFIRMMKKELDITVIPKPMVSDASSKIGQIIDTINGP